MRLFISYAHVDKPLVIPLASVLTSGGHVTWIDSDLQTGQEWRQQLAEAIKASDAIVLAISPAWLKSSVSQWEFVTAVEMGKQVIPVIVRKNDDGSNPKLPERLGKYQWADFTGGFSDEGHIQKFLDDILTLGAIVQLNKLPQISKAKLEKDAESEFAAVNRDGIQITARTIENSHITITQTINNRRWATFLILLIGVVTIGLVLLLLLPPLQRNNLLGLVGITFPSETPLPVPTSTPAPEPMPVGEFNVVVAGIGYEQTDGSIIQNNQADSISDVLSSSVSEIIGARNFRDWRSPGAGRILAKDADERGRQAGQIAETLNASVVIYGVIRASDPYYNSFEPEFYLAAPFARQDTELIGSDKLGGPVEILAGSTEQSGGSQAANSLGKRLQVVQLFLNGLSLYFQGDFTSSVQRFQDAIAVTPQGLEVLEILAGNAAVRANLSQEALDFYNAALITRPDYARALLGRGIVLFQMARNNANENAPPYDPSLKLDSQTKCSDTSAPVPSSAQLLAELSLRCYREAGQASDAPPTADIDVKTVFGIGQVNVWLTLNHFGDHWDDVQNSLQTVLSLYNKSSLERQSRLKALAAHANAWLGLRLISIAPSDVGMMQEAADYFKNAVALLTEDVNREYNQENIADYTQQYEALIQWLDAKNGNAPLLAFTATPLPTPIPTITPTLGLVG